MKASAVSAHVGTYALRGQKEMSLTDLFHCHRHTYCMSCCFIGGLIKLRGLRRVSTENIWFTTLTVTAGHMVTFC